MKQLLTSTSLALALGMIAPAMPAFAQSAENEVQEPAQDTTSDAAETGAGAASEDDAWDGEGMVLGKSGGHGAVAFMASYDDDGDGVVTRGDYFAIRDQRFRDADTDGDSLLTEQEYLAEFEARLIADYEAAGRERDKAYDSNIEQAIDRFHLLDLDKDGRMDGGEYFAQASRTFSRLDTNGDGKVDADDPAPERQPPVARADFSAPPVPFAGRIMASGPDESPVLPGATVELGGRNLPPGQRLTLQRGTTVLNDGRVKVDENGGFSFEFTLPENAAPGLYPLVVTGEEPASVTTYDLKISPDLAPLGEHLFQKTAVKGPAGLYQSAYSAASDALFVAATDFGGQGGTVRSTLVRLSPETLETQAEIVIPAAEGSDGSNMADTPAVFGIDVDDERGTVWVTNTLQDSVAVYDQSDLSLIRQFEPGLIGHSREVVVDAARGRAYVSGSTSNEVAIFDTAEPAYRDTIHVRSEERGKEFTVMGLTLDPESGHVYAISRTSAEIAEIDPEAGEVVRIIAVPGIANGVGLAFDAEAGRLLAVSQDSDDLVAVDAQSGEVAFRTPVGAGPLSVTVVEGRAFVANRGSATVTVVDSEGKVVANLPFGSYPNHVESDGKGNVFVLNKSRGPEDDSGDHITRLQ